MDQEPTKKRRASFSILTLLLITTIAGLIFALVESRNRIAKIQPELEKLKIFARPLEIEDPTRTQVISLPTGSAYLWRWRIRAGDKTRYFMGFADGKIPDQGTPAPGTTQMAGAGLIPSEEFIVTVELRPFKKGNDPDVEYVETRIKIEQGDDPANLMTLTSMANVLKVGKGGIKRYADLIMGPQYGSKPAHGLTTPGLNGQESFAADEPIQLLRAQYNKPEGIIIWFEPFCSFKTALPIAATPIIKRAPATTIQKGPVPLDNDPPGNKAQQSIYK